MGPSDAIQRITSEVERVAESDFSVVIIGETGSGKKLLPGPFMKRVLAHHVHLLLLIVGPFRRHSWRVNSLATKRELLQGQILRNLENLK